MRITKYSVMLDEHDRNVLVKESGLNYPGGDRLDGPGKIVDVMEECFQLHMRAEEFLYLICLNTKAKPLGFFEVAHGTVNSCLTSTREIMIRAILCGATGIILCHNHPSGDSTPSKEDNQITQTIKEAGNLMGIPLYDHIIIGKDNYYTYHGYDIL